MKKIFLILLMLCAMALSGVQTASAGHFGIQGGASFMGIRDVSYGLTTGYHAGLTYKFKLPLGFAIQPSLLYHMKSSAYDTGSHSVDFKVGYVELPVSFQWGPDLLLFRPYVDLSPYVGYGLNTKASLPEFKDALNKFEYGVGLGVGIEIWRLQIVGRYNWNFGTIASTVKGEGVLNSSSIQEAFGESNLGGITLTASIMF